MTKFAHTRKASIVALAGMAVLAQAPAAQAQFENRSSDSRLIHAQCLVERDSERVEEFMAAAPGSEQERSIGRRLFRGNGRCLDDTNIASINVSKLRGALSEVLVLSDAARLERLGSYEGQARAASSNAGLDMYREYGQCLAASHTEDSIAFISTPHGSRAEVNALGEMEDVQFACLPSDANSRLALADVRDYVAFALYEFSSE